MEKYLFLFKIKETGHQIKKNKDKFLIGELIFNIGIENYNNDIRIILNNLENEKKFICSKNQVKVKFFNRKK